MSQQRAMFLVIGPDGCASACAIKELMLTEAAPTCIEEDVDTAGETAVQVKRDRPAKFHNEMRAVHSIVHLRIACLRMT